MTTVAWGDTVADARAGSQRRGPLERPPRADWGGQDGPTRLPAPPFPSPSPFAALPAGRPPELARFPPSCLAMGSGENFPRRRR